MKMKNIIKKLYLLVLLMVSFVVFAENVYADEYVFVKQPKIFTKVFKNDIIFSLNTNKRVYTPNEAVIVTGQILSVFTYNDFRYSSWADLSATLNSSNKYIFKTLHIETGMSPSTIYSQTFTVPNKEGEYKIEFIMNVNTGAKIDSSGPQYYSIPIKVVAAPVLSPVLIDNASFDSYVNLPMSVSPGKTFTASIVMKNNGDTTWKAGANYKLGSQNPANNNNWGITRVELPSDIARGQTGTFTATFTAPATVGTYNFQWQMLIEGVKWFGAKSDNRTITVACEPDLTPQINTCTTATFDDKCGNLVAGTKTDGFCCPVNSCGSAVDESSTTMPTTNLCSAGNASSVSDVGGDWVWTCSSGCSNEIVANCSTKHTSDLDYTRWREVAP